MNCDDKKSARKANISAKRRHIVAAYEELWNRFITRWRGSRDEDAVWLTCSASYMLNTRGLKWAVDPYLLSTRLPEVPAHDVRDEYGDLSFVLLTHAHEDHCDPSLWCRLKDSSCHWIVPDHMTDLFLGEAEMDGVEYTVAIPGEEIDVAGVNITPFTSPHNGRHLDGRQIIVEETGYLVRVGSRSYLFPGDVRSYDPSCLDPFRGVYAVFAHVFLGREAALEPVPPLLDAFVRFYLTCNPRTVVLGHLYAFQVEVENCFVDAHAAMAVNALQAVKEDVRVVVPDWYQEVIL